MGYGEDGSGNTVLWRLVRIIVPWIALLVVLAALWSMVTDYRAATKQSETTETVEASGTAGIPDGQPYVSVLSDGLNLRAEPSKAGSIVTVLDKDEKLLYVEEVTGWYHVRRTNGAEGWVAAGGHYTELVRP